MLLRYFENKRLGIFTYFRALLRGGYDETFTYIHRGPLASKHCIFIFYGWIGRGWGGGGGREIIYTWKVLEKMPVPSESLQENQ